MRVKLIYFVRHGETEANVKGIRQGREGSLTQHGLDQALDAAKRFPQKKGKPEIIISSPYTRTKETAEVISKVLGLPIEYSPLLAERKNPTEIIGHSGKEESVQKIVDRIDKSFHRDDLRVSDEENFEDLKNRAGQLLHFIAGRKEKKIIMVTHGIFLKMVAACITLGRDLTASEYNTLSYFNTIDNAGICIVSYTTHWFPWFNQPEWRLLVWNDLM
jgi:broad specificity phosphatase PhoE